MISTTTIRTWLDNWQNLVSQNRYYDEIKSNTGPRNYDGVSWGRLNRIMLKQAIEQLPVDQRNAIICRYIRRDSLKDTLILLKVGKEKYFGLCDRGIKNIWRFVNYGPEAVIK